MSTRSAAAAPTKRTIERARRQHRCRAPSKRRHGVGGEAGDGRDHPERDHQQEDVAGSAARGVQQLLGRGRGKLGADARC